MTIKTIKNAVHKNGLDFFCTKLHGGGNALYIMTIVEDEETGLLKRVPESNVNTMQKYLKRYKVPFSWTVDYKHMIVRYDENK